MIYVASGEGGKAGISVMGFHPGHFGRTPLARLVMCCDYLASFGS